MPAIIVVGSINRDIVAFVTRHPQPGETVLGLHSAMFPGGKGANQAVAAARLRADPAHGVRMVGRVGCDSNGLELRRFLSSENIDVTGVTTCASANTGLGLIVVDAKGQNAITVISGANMDWPEAYAPLAVTPDDVVVCQLEVPLAVVRATFAAAKAVGARTVLNPAPFQSVPADILRTTDVMVLNEVELAQMLGRTDMDCEAPDFAASLQSLRQLGPTAVVVTLGAAGARLVDATSSLVPVPGRAVIAVDTTGAGDCFVGALAAGLLANTDLTTAVHFANEAAAVSVTRAGAASSIPTRQEVLAT
jgi:ribokinase